MAPTFKTGSVDPSHIGTLYDFALGFDDGTGAYLMVGYVMPKGAKWEVSTVLDDEAQSLRSVASPNQIDSRDLSPWPRVSQGDWTGGERQVTLIDPTRYYSTDGNIDITKPGALQLLPIVGVGPGNPTLTSTSRGVIPMETDGTNAFVGVSQGGPNLFWLTPTANGGTSGSVTVGGGNEIGEMCRTPEGVFVAVSGDGVYKIDNVGFTGHAVQVSNDQLSLSPYKRMVYMSGKLWYCSGAGGLTLKYITDPFPGNAPGTTALTVPTFDSSVTCLTTNSSGLVLCVDAQFFQSIIYTSDGATLTRIGEIPGIVIYGAEANGAAYLLAVLPQTPVVPSGLPPWEPNYTLYMLDGSSLSIVDDVRYDLSDFRANNPSPNTQNQNGGNIYNDGRFLYVGWPGLPITAYDLASPGASAVSRVLTSSGSGVSNLISHHVVKAGGFFVEHYATRVPSSTGTVVLQVYGDSATVGPAQTGVLTTSYFDFNTPSYPKQFRAVNFDLAQPIANASVTMSYRVDNQTTYTALTVRALTSQNLRATFPPGVLGSRIQLRITLGADVVTLASPVIRSYTVEANLGRVWRTTASCRRNQTTRAGQSDPQQLRGLDLLANLENARSTNASRCIVYVPSAAPVNPITGSDGKVVPFVDQVNVVLEHYTEHRDGGGNPGYSPDEDQVFDMEADVDLVLVETVG